VDIWKSRFELLELRRLQPAPVDAESAESLRELLGQIEQQRSAGDKFASN
jgi:hypothetical protein